MDHEVFRLGDLPLASGGVLRDGELAYVTHGTLGPARDNVVLLPSAFGGSHDDMEWLVGPGRALDTDRWFVVVPCLFGMGLSSSPTNAHATQRGADFPTTGIVDNVLAQRRLLTEVVGVESLAAVVGCSMGAIQALHWGAMHPDDVGRVVAVCGTASASEHCRVFLDGCRGAITLDAAWAGGRYTDPPEAGQRHLGRIWAGWGFSPGFYRDQTYRAFGFTTLEEFVTGFWEQYFVERDANNLLHAIAAWAGADITRAVPGCTAADALARITAPVLLMPAETDAYFPPGDVAVEAALIPRADVRPVPGVYGHFSCSGGFPEQAAFITAAVRDFLGTAAGTR